MPEHLPEERSWLAASERVVHVREVGHLSYRDIAGATGVGVSTAGAWMRRTHLPTGECAERLAELLALVGRLARVMEPDYIPIWLYKPVGILDDGKPIDMLAHGEYQQLSRLISELETPVFS